MKKISLIITLIVFASAALFSQVTYEPAEGSKMIVKGTSTLHDWTSETGTLGGTFIFKSSVKDKKFPASGSILEEVKLIVPVTSIKSERGDAMNNKTHNAFGYETNPDIVFLVTSDEITSTSEGTFSLKVNGTLTMAGHSENVTISLSGDKPAKNQLHFTGSHPIDMTLYGMEPPSAMFGQIKTGKDVTIEFDLLLTEK